MNAPQIYDVLIVGGGHAGAQTAITLRSLGFEGTIGLVGDEQEYPYERPPLSKEYLSGDKPFERIQLRPASYWVEKHLILIQGYRVVSIDTDNNEVTLANGQTVGYGNLVWATGGDPRKLSCAGSQLHGVHYVRNRANVDAIMDSLANTHSIVVVGGGYIGLEAAAVLSKLGKKVVLLEALPRVLARVAGEELSAFFEKEHRAHGVDLRTGATVVEITGSGSVTGVVLDSGETIAAQMVIVGVGITPSVQPLLAAGADGGNGVFVDAQCRSSIPNVFAIGDCAAHANDFADGSIIRLESIQNANDMGAVAAKTICGMDVIYKATPWFWSNQYDLKLQTVGLSTGYDETVLRGDPETRSFSIIYLKAGRVIALDCVNNVRDFSQGRRLVELGVSVDAASLADTSVMLKEWGNPTPSA